MSLLIEDDARGVSGGPCPVCGAELMLILDEIDEPVALAHPLPWCDTYKTSPDTLVASLALGAPAGGDA